MKLRILHLSLLFCHVLFSATDLCAQIKFQKDIDVQGISGVKVISEYKAEGVIVKYSLVNNDSSILIVEEVDLDLNAGFNYIPSHGIKRDTTYSASLIDSTYISKFGLPSGAYASEIVLKDSLGRIKHREINEWEHFSENLAVSFLEPDSVKIRSKIEEPVIILIQTRFGTDTVEMNGGEAVIPKKHRQTSKYSLLLGSTVWDTYPKGNEGKALPVVDDQNILDQNKGSAKSQHIISIKQLTLSSTGEFRDHPLPGTLYEYPYFTQSVNGIVSVGNIPFRASGMLYLDRNFTMESLKSPMNYFTIEYDENLWQEQQVNTAILHNQSLKVKDKQYDLLKKRQRLSADIHELQLDSVQLLKGNDFPTDPLLTTDSLNYDANVDLNKLDRISKKAERLKDRKKRFDDRLHGLSQKQEKIKSLSQRFEAGEERITMKELSLDSTRFKSLTPKVQNVKSFKVGNIFPTRFSYTPMFHYYTQLIGTSAEYRVSNNSTVYGLVGRTRTGPFSWADSLNVHEVALNRRFGDHSASVLVSRTKPTGDATEQVNGLTGEVGYVVEPSLELALGRNTSLGASISYFHSPSSDSIHYNKTRSLLYLTGSIGAIETESYAELTMPEYHNPLELSAVPDMLRLGQRFSYMFNPLKTVITSGVIFNYQGVTGDNKNKSVNFEAGLQTLFKNIPNLTLKYSPFAGNNSFSSPSGVATMAYQHNTSSLLAALTYSKALKRMVLSSSASYLRLRNIVVFPSSQTYNYEGRFEVLTLSATLSNSKQRMSISGSAFKGEATQNSSIQAGYMRHIGRVLSLGMNMYGGQSNNSHAYSAGIPVQLRINKMFTLYLESGYSYLVEDQSSVYARVQGVFVF